MNDKLKQMFEKQTEVMVLLRDDDKLPEWPIDITSKQGQRLIKEMIFNMIEELAEASFTLKNRAHRQTDARDVDVNHYKEELGDALAYFLEVCIFSGFAADDIFNEYLRKNKVVKERFEKGY